MKYLYNCATCKTDETIGKSLAEIDRLELCSTCMNPMQRVLTSTFHSFKDNKDYIYQPAFGTYTRTNRDVKDQIKKLNYEKGMRVEHVGDAQPESKPQREDWSYSFRKDACDYLKAQTKEANRRGAK